MTNRELVKLIFTFAALYKISLGVLIFTQKHSLTDNKWGSIEVQTETKLFYSVGIYPISKLGQKWHQAIFEIQLNRIWTPTTTKHWLKIINLLRFIQMPESSSDSGNIDVWLKWCSIP